MRLRAPVCGSLWQIRAKVWMAPLLIKRGGYPPGSALPSQPDLAREYNLNQTSINRAIALLRAEGLVRVEHGRGAFVHEIPTVKRTRRIPREDQAGSSFAEEMRKAGLDPRTELAGLDTVPAPADIAEHLHISAGSQSCGGPGTCSPPTGRSSSPSQL